MTPYQMEGFILDTQKSAAWDMHSPEYKTWREYLEELGKYYGLNLQGSATSSTDCYKLVEAGADGNEIIAVFTLLFN